MKKKPVFSAFLVLVLIGSAIFALHGCGSNAVTPAAPVFAFPVINP